MEEIQMAEPYQASYWDVVDLGAKQVEEKFKPEIKPLTVDLKDYDTVILGSPIWWYHYAPAMRTLLESCDWTGKTIYPFITNAGWPGETLEEIALACKGADVKPGLDIRFDTSDLDKMKTSENEVLHWIESIKEMLHL